MNIPFLDLKAQYRMIEHEVNPAIATVLQRADFVLGEEVTAFEAAFARYCDARYAVGVDSGYAALELMLRAVDIGPGAEVITAANTFVATALAITRCGAKPVLVDADPRTFTLDPTKLESAITPATRAILPVHLYGQPADMEPIWEIADRHNLLVFEDAAQAHGARYKGRVVGNLGHAAAFSFYPGKNLGAYGDGGAVVTNDALLADRVRLLRNLGQRVKYEHQIKGFNHRLDTLQAAVLQVKLPHLDRWNADRRRIAAAYSRGLAGLPVITPRTHPNIEHVYHLYVICVRERDALQQHLKHKGVATGLHYPTPIHLQPAYAELNGKIGDFPITEALATEILSLPIYAEMTDAMVDYVITAIAEFFADNSTTIDAPIDQPTNQLINQPTN